MMGLLYRIYTEDLKDGMAEGIMADYFHGLTVYRAQGCWKGTFENTLVLEVITDREGDVAVAAAKIREVCGQQAVLVTVQALERVGLVTANGYERF